MTDEQGLALARLMRDRPDTRNVEVIPEPYGLPEGYVEATLEQGAGASFVCGIAPDGRVSS